MGVSWLYVYSIVAGKRYAHSLGCVWLEWFPPPPMCVVCMFLHTLNLEGFGTCIFIIGTCIFIIEGQMHVQLTGLKYVQT